MEQYLRTMNGTSYSGLTTSDTVASAGVWTIVALVLAIVGGILVYFLFVKPENDPKNKFLKRLKDFLAFKTMWIEAILKVLYYILTIFFILSSFVLIPVSFLAFISTLVVMPIVIRLVYEFSMMFIMIWRNTRDIAENTKSKK